MTSPETQVDPAQNDREVNFRRQEKAMQDKYERILSQERAEKEKLAQELAQRQRAPIEEDDEDDDEPYVVKKKLDKKLAKFGEQAQKQTQSEIQRAVQTALQEERQNKWMEDNHDFENVMLNSEKLYQRNPKLAETILRMPQGFERQKLVYYSLKELGLDRPAQKEPSIQDKIDANKKSYFYQPSGVGTAPYTSASDFSPAGQKQAHDLMQGLKNRLRLG